MAIAEDVSTPAVVSQQGTGTTDGTPTLTTASFTPPDHSLVVAVASGGWNGSTGTVTGVTISDSLAGTWTQGAKAAGTSVSFFGIAGVYFQYFASTPGSITVSAAFTGLRGTAYLAVRVLTGAGSDQSTGASATKIQTTGATSFTQSITTTTTGSVVYGGVSDSFRSSTLGAASNTTLVDSVTNVFDNDAVAIFKATAATGTPGAITLGVTTGVNADGGNLAMREILPAPPVKPVSRSFFVEQQAWMTSTL